MVYYIFLCIILKKILSVFFCGDIIMIYRNESLIFFFTSFLMISFPRVGLYSLISFARDFVDFDDLLAAESRVNLLKAA